MSDVMISVRNFKKSYGANPAVRDISFEVKKGEIFALLGPNGSGKTTTLESLEGLRHPDGGSLAVAGVDPTRYPRKLRKLIGVQLQSSALPPAMTVDEAMKFFCAYHGVGYREDLIDRLGLKEKRKDQFGRLSTGQQRRLALALAVAHSPQVIFLDEPTAGLDVQSRVELHILVAALKKSGSTVILATHDMAEAEKLADRAAILLKGRIAAVGSPRQLTASGKNKTRILVASENGYLPVRKAAFPGATYEGSKDGYATYISDSPGKAVSAILAWLEQAGDSLIDLRVERPSLEERFLELTADENEKGGAQ